MHSYSVIFLYFIWNYLKNKEEIMSEPGEKLIFVATNKVNFWQKLLPGTGGINKSATTIIYPNNKNCAS